jgi:hypothetical protein
VRCKKKKERHLEVVEEVTGMEGKEIGTKGSDDSDNTELEGTAIPSFSEVETCVRKMNNKSPGEDNIVVEMIKSGGKVLIKKIHELICVIWKKEEMPDTWRLGIICPIFKKGDTRICDNYRGITLLDVAYKILSSIINQRIKGFAERIIGEYQAGFRANKSIINKLFVIRQTIEKHYEHNSELHMLFIDFKQAFDSINRERLYETMEIMGIPQKLIKLV